MLPRLSYRGATGVYLERVVRVDVVEEWRGWVFTVYTLFITFI